MVNPCLSNENFEYATWWVWVRLLVQHWLFENPEADSRDQNAEWNVGSRIRCSCEANLGCVCQKVIQRPWLRSLKVCYWTRILIRMIPLIKFIIQLIKRIEFITLSLEQVAESAAYLDSGFAVQRHRSPDRMLVSSNAARTAGQSLHHWTSALWGPFRGWCLGYQCLSGPFGGSDVWIPYQRLRKLGGWFVSRNSPVAGSVKAERKCCHVQPRWRKARLFAYFA